MARDIILYENGSDAFDAIIRRIRSARKCIDISMFIWRDDLLGRVIMQELIGAADRGVRVAVRKDAVGWVFECAEENRKSLLHKHDIPGFWLHQKIVHARYGAGYRRYARMMFSSNPYLLLQSHARNRRWRRGIYRAEKGVVERFLAHPHIIIDLSVRNDHSKYFIFDDDVVVLGGMNMEEKHVSRDLAGRRWLDYMVELRGKEHVVRLHERLAGTADFDPSRRVDFLVNVRGERTGAGRRFEFECDALSLLSRAKRVQMEMAYLGNTSITRLLAELARRGSDVSIALSSHANVQQDHNMRVAKGMLRKSDGLLQFYLCSDMLHAKAFVVDSRVVVLGSANLNRQSMDRLGELDVMVNDVAFARQVLAVMRARRRKMRKIVRDAELRYSKINVFFEGMLADKTD